MSPAALRPVGVWLKWLGREASARASLARRAHRARRHSRPPARDLSARPFQRAALRRRVPNQHALRRIRLALRAQAADVLVWELRVGASVGRRRVVEAAPRQSRDPRGHCRRVMGALPGNPASRRLAAPRTRRRRPGIALRTVSRPRYRRRLLRSQSGRGLRGRLPDSTLDSPRHLFRRAGVVAVPPAALRTKARPARGGGPRPPPP